MSIDISGEVMDCMLIFELKINHWRAIIYWEYKSRGHGIGKFTVYSMG